MEEELFRNKIYVSSPTSISIGNCTWYALDTKLVGRVKALIEENENLKECIKTQNFLLDKQNAKILKLYEENENAKSNN